MKYPVLKKDLIGIPAGTKGYNPDFQKDIWSFASDTDFQIFRDSKINALPDWFEWKEAPERITIEWLDLALTSNPPQYRTQATFKGIFTDAGKQLVEQAINGELFTKQDMVEFGIYSRRWENWNLQLPECLSQWIKERNGNE